MVSLAQSDRGGREQNGLEHGGEMDEKSLIDDHKEYVSESSEVSSHRGISRDDMPSRTKKGKAGFLLLPPELLFQVLSACLIDDIGRLTSVCSAFKEICGTALYNRRFSSLSFPLSLFSAIPASRFIS